MLFNSLAFLGFLPIVCLIYFAGPARLRVPVLLVASLYFYMSWNPRYVILMFISASVDYFAAMGIVATTSPVRRRAILGISLATNLAILFFFKYYDFFAQSLKVILPGQSGEWLLPFHFLLPVGISFYTFQSMAYTIDVYRGALLPERRWVQFMCFVSFFPQLVAGPIERATHVMPQLRRLSAFEYRRTVDGLQLIMWGFFKKIVVADRLAIFVDRIYGAPDTYHGLPLWIGTYFFAFQIYADFSAYSDIAIGTAKIFGVDLMRNFAQPYLARSIGDFWRRWHISLSTWFRDYVYFPIGGNRTTTAIWCRNLAVVFVLSGLWHGAAWTFVLWGALHATFLITGLLTRDLRAKIVEKSGIARLPALLASVRVLVTFHLVTISWVLFRADSVQHAWRIYAGLFDFARPSFEGLSRPQLMLAVVGLVAVNAFDWFQYSGSIRPVFNRQPQWIRWTVYVSGVACILAFGEFRSKQFIYFQF